MFDDYKIKAILNRLILTLSYIIKNSKGRKQEPQFVILESTAVSYDLLDEQSSVHNILYICFTNISELNQ